MTTRQQKDLEIRYAKKAGGLLGESWKVKSSPNEASWPDLVVTIESKKFGLEVREIYLDEYRKGSAKKASEQKNLRKIEKLANAYYNKNSTPIIVDFLGDIGQHDKLLNAITKEVGQLSEWDKKRIEPYRDCVIYIQKLPDQCVEYAEWYYVSDRVGWVRDMDTATINNAISEKAKNLPKYTQKIQDVRLLLVSDREHNSGNARLTNDIICDSCGFTNVYYLLYPNKIVQLI